MCSGWCDNWVTQQHARCNNENGLCSLKCIIIIIRPSFRFKYLRTTSTNQNCFHEGTKTRPKLRTTFCLTVYTLLSCSLLLKNIKIKICKTIIFSLFCMGAKLGLSHGERNVDWRCLRIGCWGRYWGLRQTRWQGNWRRLRNEEVRDLYSPNISGDQTKKNAIAAHVAHMGDKRGYGEETWEAHA